MARPTKRTPETEQSIVDALAKGYTRKAAAAMGGVHYDTMREWEKADSEFSDALQKAEGIAQAGLMDRIIGAAAQGATVQRRDGTVIFEPGAWQAAAWILERRWPREYGKREAVEMSGPDGGPIEHRDLASIPDHERSALSRAIQRHLRGETEPEGDPAGDRTA